MSERKSWTAFRPRFQDKRSQRVLAEFASDLSHSGDGLDRAQRRLSSRKGWPRRDEQALLAASLLLLDFRRQGWHVRVKALEVKVAASSHAGVSDSKEFARQQELIGRDEQLNRPSVRKFIQGMETRRVFNGSLVSIFDLMRDGTDLAEGLRKVRELGAIDFAKVREVVDPYIQVVAEGALCDKTGLRLQDIWRYFRLTWSTPYLSVPGRSMPFLIRDRAVPSHPVIGIAALSSSIVQLSARDAWLGWDWEGFQSMVLGVSNKRLSSWIETLVGKGLDELYLQDFIEEGLISRRDLRVPDGDLLDRLRLLASTERRKHQRFTSSRDLKSDKSTTAKSVKWKLRARSHLFRSKRALALADLLEARLRLVIPLKEGESVRTFLKDRAAASALKRLVRRAKADLVGAAIADISVCGAIPPYNAPLGGKLVSGLMATPQVLAAYRARYQGRPSEIASSMAGKPISKPADLVFLGTSSLYSVGSSQYNRIKIPAEVLGGPEGEWIKYEKVGKSRSYGTSHLSQPTIQALTLLAEQSSTGQRVNSIFGEGVNPKLRKVRQGLDTLGLPSDFFLRHGRERILYGVTLVNNLSEYLLGFHRRPQYKIARADSRCTARTVDWWMGRWLLPRIQSDAVLEEVEKHVLVHPVRHGARPGVPRDETQLVAD